MSDPDEIDGVLLAWAQAGGDAAEVQRRVTAVRARLGVTRPAETAPPTAPPAETSTPAPPPRVPFMDMTRPNIAPPPRTPWVNPEYTAEIERTKTEISEMFAQARDPFFAGKKHASEHSDGDSRQQIGLKKRR